MFDDYPRNAGDPGIPNPCCGSFKTQMISARTAFRQWRFVRRFSTSGVQMESGAVYDSVQQYYGKVLGGSKDLKTNACTTSGALAPQITKALMAVPQAVKDKYYGCGTPLPDGIQGLDLLDLGSGSGRDCYVAAALVGTDGSVTGVDMTEEQLDVAMKHVPEYMEKLGYKETNLRFKKGHIEYLKDAGIEDESMDMVISNCVINLSPNKDLVLQGVYDALREGGELYFSDVYCDRRLPDYVRKHDIMLGECLGGALYVEDFKRICHDVGFLDPRQSAISTIEVTDPDLKDLCGNAKFYSITYRCFKLSSLETLCEDYGQVAFYNGTIPNNPHSYMLDEGHVFETGKPMLVCGNTASMVQESWMKDHFKVMGDRDVHFGLFDCGPKSVPVNVTDSETASAGGGCC